MDVDKERGHGGVGREGEPESKESNKLLEEYCTEELRSPRRREGLSGLASMESPFLKHRKLMPSRSVQGPLQPSSATPWGAPCNLLNISGLKCSHLQNENISDFMES